MRQREEFKSILDKTISGLGSAEAIRQSMAAAYWSEAVGPAAASASEPDRIVNGVLHVSVEHPVWSQELTLLKREILRQINSRLGGWSITDIRFHVANLPQNIQEPIQRGPNDLELERVTLTEEDTLRLKNDLLAAETIEDDKIRETTIKMIQRNIRLRRWRLEHGWHSCKKCSAAHHTDQELCPICRYS